ncbi:uncharacterized protein LOC128200051 [Galleria mellonella]|uniref:Uncharacterized protein LOC128200051 n=1 Tax=Galleria mellonella TaxID=7137 RepID=A0ABM3M983_GALME|nr:uncharacterized protein LOC128200051 [Galleria mellonella]
MYWPEEETKNNNDKPAIPTPHRQEYLAGDLSNQRPGQPGFPNANGGRILGFPFKNGQVPFPRGTGGNPNDHSWPSFGQNYMLHQNVYDQSRIPPPPPENATVNLPLLDDFGSPIKWVAFNSNETSDGLAKLTVNNYFL